MKRLLACIIAILLAAMSIPALAAEVDLASMTDDEIQNLIDAGRNVLLERSLVADGKTLVFEQDGISLYLMGDMNISSSGFLYVKAIIVNDSNTTVSLTNNACSINGWMTFMNGFGAVAPGKKASGELSFDVRDTDIASVEDIEEIEFCIDVFDKDTPKIWFTTEPVVVYFKGE